MTQYRSVMYKSAMSEYRMECVGQPLVYKTFTLFWWDFIKLLGHFWIFI